VKKGEEALLPGQFSTGVPRVKYYRAFGCGECWRLSTSSELDVISVVHSGVDITL